MNEKVYAQHKGIPSLEQDEKPYTTEVTRVHNKRFAPEGSIFLVIRHRVKNAVYTNYHLVPFGMEEKHNEVFEMLWTKMATKYNLS